MIEMISKSGGKVVGKISDSNDGEDYLIIDGKKCNLSQVYDSKELQDMFNKELTKEKAPNDGKPAT